MKQFLTLVFVFSFLGSHSQWTRELQLPASTIYSLYRDDSDLLAGGQGIVYFSRDKGETWDSTSLIPGLNSIDAIIVHRNELYVASYGYGVYKSRDFGRTWTNIENGIIHYVSQFCTWRGNLYAATLGGGVFLLDSVRLDQWINYNQGLSNLSLNLYCIAANARTLVAGALTNGTFDRRPIDTSAWSEQFVLNRINPNEGFYDIVTAHDSLFMAGFKAFYLSTNDGLDWNTIATPLFASVTTLLNTNEALLLVRNYTNSNTITNSLYYYVRKDSLQYPAIPFSTVDNRFTYRMQILGGRLWAATTDGLYYMPISGLPGITPANDTDSSGNQEGSPPDSVKTSFGVGNVYPNPISVNGRIQLQTDEPGELSAALFDAGGKLVQMITGHQRLQPGQTILSLNMNNLSTGTYFLRLIINGRVFLRKIIHTSP